MAKITWCPCEVPPFLPVTQVYGIVFDTQGRILLKVEEKGGKQIFGLPGGTPEDFDADRIATLRRELREEVNVAVGTEVLLLGYQKIEGDGGRPPYAQMRMTAVITEIGERRPDPDTGETYCRLLCSFERAITLLGWGKVADEQIRLAAELAAERLRIPVCREVEEIWI